MLQSFIQSSLNKKVNKIINDQGGLVDIRKALKVTNFDSIE